MDSRPDEPLPVQDVEWLSNVHLCGGEATLARVRCTGKRLAFKAAEWTLLHVPRDDTDEPMEASLDGRPIALPRVRGVSLWVRPGLRCEVRTSGAPLELLALGRLAITPLGELDRNPPVEAPFLDPTVTRWLDELATADPGGARLRALGRWLGRRGGAMTHVPRTDDALPPERLFAVVNEAHEGLSDGIDVARLAERAGLGATAFARAFKAVVGMPPRTYLTLLRVEEASVLLCRASDPNVSSVAAQVGFYDQSHLHRHFKRVLGLTPGQFLRRVEPRATVVAPLPTSDDAHAGTLTAWLDTIQRRRTQPSPSLRPGAIVGQEFEIVRALGWDGRGGLRYVALHRPTGAWGILDVAERSPEHEREHHEALEPDLQIVRSWSHPTLPELVASDVVEGRPHMLWADTPGDTLAVRVEQAGPLDLHQALQIAEPLVQGLHQAHERGLTHDHLDARAIRWAGERHVHVVDWSWALFVRARFRLRDEPFDVDPATDVRALGRTLLAAILGQDVVREGVVAWPTSCQLPEAARALFDWSVRAPAQTSMVDFLTQIRQTQAAVPRPLPTPVRTTRPVSARDPFVGRTDELAWLDAALAQGPSLVGVIGEAGVGKSRVVEEWSRRFVDAAEGAVAWVDLTNVPDLPSIVTEVAQALGMGLATTDRADVGRIIGRHPALVLVLDNCEHLVDAVRELLQQWLTDASTLRCVTTSRISLRSPGEQTLRLEPLATHRGGSAWDLFLVRARDRRPTWRLLESEEADLVALLADLDGLPLAIELASARAGMLSLRQMRFRMRDRFALLRTREAHRPERHRTLWGALYESWSLLEASEQSLLAQLAVFRGPWALEDAEAVVQVEHDPSAYVLDLVERLVDTLWVRLDPRAHHFSMLVSTRAFALMQLQRTGRHDEAMVRYARHYATWGTQAHRARLRNEPITSVAAQLPNLSTARNWLLDQPGPEAHHHAHLIASVIAQVAVRRGPHQLMTPLLAALRPEETSEPAQRVLECAARGALDNRQFEAATASLQRAISMAEARGDEHSAAFPSAMLGNVKNMAGADPSEAEAFFDQAEQVAKVHADPRLLAIVNLYRADGAGLRGDYEAHRAHCERALSISRGLNEPVVQRGAARRLATNFANRGNVQKAEAIYRDLIAEETGLGDQFQVAFLATQLAWVCVNAGKLDDADRALAIAAHLIPQLGVDWLESMMRGFQGRVAHRRGDLAAARQSLREAFSIAESLQSVTWMGIWESYLAEIDYDAGQVLAARDRFAQALVHLSDRDNTTRIGATAFLGLCELSLGRRGAAVEQLERLRPLLKRSPQPRHEEGVVRSRELARRLGLTLDVTWLEDPDESARE